MAVALPPTPRSIGFPHNILHENTDSRAPHSMDQSTTQKPSLPSISSLIEAVKDQPQNGLDRSPSFDHERKLSAASSGYPTSPDRSVLMGSPRSHHPPTPPLPGTSSFDFPPRHSPGNTSPASTSNSHPGHYPHTTNGTAHEHYSQQLRSSYPPIPEPGQWHSAPDARSPTGSSQSGSTRKDSYPEPPATEGQYPANGLAQQRPLPATFPPVPGQALPPIDPQMAPLTPTQPPTWQHHHYFPPTNAASFPPAADRYVCTTCQKPFSRPSSLKIHTYSHTGEKPFKCKHDGCGKYFSVRSNMKRHEKGCHGGDSSSTGGNSPKA